MNKISSAVSVGRTHARDEQQKNVNTSADAKPGSINSSQERDDLVLTGAAQQILKATSAQQSLPDIDQDKIDKIKLAIESNSYEVSARRIASKLVEMEKL